MSSDFRGTWRLLAPHALPHKWALVAIGLLGTIVAFGERSVYLLVSPVWTALWPAKATPPETEVAEPTNALLIKLEAWKSGMNDWLFGSSEHLTDSDRLHALVRIALVVVVIAIGTGICQYAFTMISRWLSLKVVVELRLRIAKHLMGLSMRYHNSRQFGDLLSRISADVNVTLGILNDGFRDLLLQPLQGIMGLVLAIFMAPMAAFWVMVGLPLVLLPVLLLGKKVRKGSTKSLTSLGASVQALAQMFQGIRTVKAFRAEDRELEGYREQNAVYIKDSMRMVRALSATHAGTTLLTFSGIGGMLLLIGWMQIKQETFDDGGEMAAFFILVSQATTNLKRTSRMWARVQESVGATERLQELLEEAVDVTELPTAHSIDGIEDEVRLTGVSFQYPDSDRKALDGIDLTIHKGETLALVGASGSGKTTLVDLVARFLDPDAGSITVDGHDLRELTKDSWVSQFAMVSQTPFLFHASIEENIRYGKPNASHAEVVAAARAAGIHEHIESLAEGYGTDVADMGARLSGGQRQRLTIARALLKGAPLLLLDEATSALDTQTEALVQDALERLMEGRTVIVIAHRLSTIRDADRIAVLDEGKLVELGTHEELLAKGGHYAVLHAAQFSTDAD